MCVFLCELSGYSTPFIKHLRGRYSRVCLYLCMHACTCTCTWAYICTWACQSQGYREARACAWVRHGTHQLFFFFFLAGLVSLQWHSVLGVCLAVKDWEVGKLIPTQHPRETPPPDPSTQHQPLSTSPLCLLIGCQPLLPVRAVGRGLHASLLHNEPHCLPGNKHGNSPSACNIHKYASSLHLPSDCFVDEMKSHTHMGRCLHHRAGVLMLKQPFWESWIRWWNNDFRKRRPYHLRHAPPYSMHQVSKDRIGWLSWEHFSPQLVMEFTLIW